MTVRDKKKIVFLKSYTQSVCNDRYGSARETWHAAQVFNFLGWVRNTCTDWGRA